MQKTIKNSQMDSVKEFRMVLNIFIWELDERANQVEAESIIIANTIREVVTQINTLATTIKIEKQLRLALDNLREELRHKAQDYVTEADKNPRKALELLDKETGLQHVLYIFNQYVISAIDYYNQGHNLILQALEAFQISVSFQEHAKTYEHIATTLKALGRDDEALKAITRAYELNPKNSKTATLYAEMLHLHDKNNEAITVLKAVLERHTTYKPAKRLLELIERDNS